MARVDLRSAKDIEFVTRKGRRQRLRAARVAVVCLVAAGSLVPMTLLAPAAAAYSTPTVAAGTPALAAPAAAPQAAPAPLAAPAPAPAGNELNGVVWLLSLIHI